MNSTKINTILARAKDVLNLIDCGELDPVNNHKDMVDIHAFTLELGEAFKDSYHDYIHGDGLNTDRLLAAFREVRRALPIMENNKRWQSWAAHDACN
jgi:hypothetical protein